MRHFIFSFLTLFLLAGAASAARLFADILAVDAEKGTVTYVVTFGKNKGAEFKIPVAKDCVFKEGYYRLGKPAVTKEGDDIKDGLKNMVFQKASAENPLRANIFTAEEDDAAKGVKKGDVLKILVNPKFKPKAVP